jgi:hypothetical protein
MNRLIASAAAALLLACAGSNTAPVSFSVATVRPAGGSNALIVATGIDIQRVRLNVGRLKLEGPATRGSDDSDGGVDGEEAGEVELRQGPFVIDLPETALDGTVTKVFDASVPPGTYREFRVDIFPGAGLQNASVIVDGAIDGQAFSFVSTLLAEQKKEGSFVVGNGSANITLSFDPARWFGTSAAPLDPRVEANRTAIEANIRSSIDVFQDDDGSGHESHHGEDGGHT